MKILFLEEQKFRQWLVWIILIGLNLLFLIGLYKQIYLNETFGSKPMSNSALVYTFISTLLLSALFFIIKLKTVITEKNITVKLMPFNLKLKSYNWTDVENAFVRKYSPLREFGGWGIRGLGKNRAINVSGNIGLQLVLNNKSKMLIGTQKGEELSSLMESLKQADKF